MNLLLLTCLPRSNLDIQGHPCHDLCCPRNNMIYAVLEITWTSKVALDMVYAVLEITWTFKVVLAIVYANLKI